MGWVRKLGAALNICDEYTHPDRTDSSDCTEWASQPSIPTHD